MDNLSEVELLERLVAFNTVSSNSNLALIDFIRSYLSSWNVASETIFDATGAKANLVASIGPLERPGFVLSGHTDVVPVEGQDWTRDPFRLTREGGKLFGRGTTDMKGFVACVLARVPRMLAKPLQTPLHLVFSYDEEVGCLGVHGIVQHIDKAIPRPIAAFVGEPTLMGVVDGHKGSTGLLTNVVGKSCHSSRPDLGVNAIFHAADLIVELRRYADELSAAPEAASPFEVPYTSVSVGVVQGGTARNSIPGDCAIQWDIRATRPGVVESLTQRFEAFVAETALPAMRGRYADASIATKLVYDVPPLLPDVGSIAETLAKRFAGKNETATVNYGSEAGIFQAAGIPTVLCGPGGDGQAHITDEWIAVDQLGACNEFLDRLIAHAREG
jgi:acetylornithine deacetylase